MSRTNEELIEEILKWVWKDKVVSDVNNPYLSERITKAIIMSAEKMAEKKDEEFMEFLIKN